LLIDFSTPPSVPVVGTEKLSNPFDGFNPSSVLRNGKVAVRKEEEQTAAREREQREQREQEKQAILDQRAARRKSMGKKQATMFRRLWS
jgi:kinetochore protein Spc7/SPC105